MSIRESLLKFNGDFPSEQEELDARRHFMNSEGYESCNIAACNCNSWHRRQSHYVNRLKEENEAKDEIIANVILQAQIWASEAKTQKSIVHEVNQIVSGATGEKADWNGANPVREKIAKLESEVSRLQDIINTPENDNFISAIAKEAEHQKIRWPEGHDDIKTAWDWFWLIGYLSQKACSSFAAGDMEKYKHHIITTAATLLNWHKQALKKSTETVIRKETHYDNSNTTQD